MALRGNLRDFSLPDVFQLVAFSQKTGVLRIDGPEAEGTVWFREGEVFFAQSDWKHDPLGQRLVVGGKITAAALGRALEIQAEEGTAARRLGQILVAEGYISEQVLEAFVQEQIQDTIFDLMRWDEGEFDFEPLELPSQEDIGLAVSIENIIMEGSRRLDEWNRIKKKIPSMDIVFKMATAPGEGTFEISLKPIEWHLLLKVDGTRTIQELGRDTSRTDFEVARILYGLFSAGLLEVAADEEVERLRAERARYEERLASVLAVEAEPTRTPEPEPTRTPEPELARTPEPVPAPSAEAPPEPLVVEVPPPPPVAAEQPREPEVPAFLSGDQGTASSEDIAVFEQMIGAVLDATKPEPAVVAAEPEAEPEPAVAIIEPEPAVAAAEPEPEPAVAAAEPEAEPEPEVAIIEPEPAVAVAEPVAEPEPEVAIIEPEPAVAVAEPVAEPEPEVAIVVEPTAEGEADTEAARTGDFETDLRAMGLGEVPVELAEPMGAAPSVDGVSPVEMADDAMVTVPDEQEGRSLTELLTSLQEDEEVEESGVVVTEPSGAEPQSGMIATPALEDETPVEGVISTDAFLSDFEVSAESVGLSSGIGDELTALTGAQGVGQRPSATVNWIPEPGQGGARIRRDVMVDPDLVRKIIEGIEKL